MTIDFHTHVLPGIDDGSSSIDESLALLRLQASQGITHTVATPHFYPRHHSLEDFLQRRERAREALCQAMAGQSGLPALTVGAEVHYFPGISASDEIQRLTIGERRFILIEMPHGDWTDKMYRDLAQIAVRQDITPVIAHVDRYLNFLSDKSLPQRLMDAGCLIQANASFFLTPLMAPMAMRLLRREQIHLLGSDCHDLQQRPPRLGAALDKIRAKLGQQAIDRLDKLGTQVLFGA